ncbi:MATE family efflux transporter [Peptoclostridium sp. AF21-18]|uniref:MATE family efflux transporter n=1 Tax=Peptoclostridium sp. AF21-18 TaxID=2292243 RepID=UPI000E4C9ACF|nr:MATE family efflux transporter [Peptoclostridium sp. AF21-18]RHQ98098.1 MATE family efflux transporter [Peptoclostridium sp. AF21-18]
MNKDLTIDKKRINRQFMHYVIPSMIAMLFSGFYSIVDGLFVGNSIGNVGLAAINLVYPIQVVLNATATGVGIGGSVLVSIYRGEGKERDMEHSAMQTIILLLIFGAILPVFFLGTKGIILNFLGAEGAIYKGADDYITTILIGGMLPVLGNGLNPIVRNQGKPIVATQNMVAGLVTNIVLDYVFIYKMNLGMFGAALATITAQGVVATMNVIYVVKLNHKNFKMDYILPNIAKIKRIMKIAVSPFGQTIVPSIIIILTNWKCIEYGGDGAVAIYSVISYVLACAQLLIQGIGDGVQPLFSYYFGANKERELHYVYNKAFFLCSIFSVFLMVMTMVFSVQLAKYFNISPELMNETALALKTTAFAYAFFGVTRVTSAYFYATNHTKFSNLLIYIEPIVIAPAMLWIFTELFGLSGVWMAYPAIQLILSSISLVLKSPNMEHKKELKVATVQ